MANAEDSLPRWMQGSWSDPVRLRAEPSHESAPLWLDEPEETPAARSRPALSVLAAIFLAVVGLMTLTAASLAVPGDGLTVPLPEALPWDAPDAGDAEALPVTLTPEETAVIRAAIESDLAAAQGYEGPRPQGIALRFASDADRDRALLCMTQAIYYEAGIEPEAGQRAVAQVVINRIRHPAYPNSVCGVVYQGAMRAGGGCQFTFTCDGALARRPVATVWERARRYAREAIDGRAFGEVGFATHYHTLEVWPHWGRRLTMTNMIGRHLFHRLRGNDGGPGAFTVRYTGHEPAPRPWQPRETDNAAADIAAAVQEADNRLPPAPAIREAAASGSRLPAEPNNLPQSRPIERSLPNSQVRPEFQESGRWIGS
ncbi:cell wall hydrolase [Parasphingopyxis marina]|uniref:Cell wall hydrolase n=1 Tax=Parasphingopyxis marina TaxID=2761622 RepID=A0A842I2Q0_9SPHN|nr:cell wall hydrolase [Parasphingopyxis marina]MBC2779181.1 cell wall hydrolase [Parasphingopyxis marina]